MPCPLTQRSTALSPLLFIYLHQQVKVRLRHKAGQLQSPIQNSHSIKIFFETKIEKHKTNVSRNTARQTDESSKCAKSKKDGDRHRSEATLCKKKKNTVYLFQHRQTKQISKELHINAATFLAF